jgi:hypothetical protein
MENEYEDWLKGFNPKEQKATENQARAGLEGFLLLHMPLIIQFKGVEAQVNLWLTSKHITDNAIKMLLPQITDYIKHLSAIKTEMAAFPTYTFVPQWRTKIDLHTAYMFNEMTFSEAPTARKKLYELLEGNKNTFLIHQQDIKPEKQDNYDWIGRPAWVSNKEVRLVNTNNKYGVITKDESVLIAPKWHKIEIFSYNFTAYDKIEMVLFDRDGLVILTEQHSYPANPCNLIFKFYLQKSSVFIGRGTCYVVSEEGEILLNTSVYGIAEKIQTIDLAEMMVLWSSSYSGPLQLIDKNGKVVIDKRVTSCRTICNMAKQVYGFMTVGPSEDSYLYYRFIYYNCDGQELINEPCDANEVAIDFFVKPQLLVFKAGYNYPKYVKIYSVKGELISYFEQKPEFRFRNICIGESYFAINWSNENQENGINLYNKKGELIHKWDTFAITKSKSLNNDNVSVRFINDDTLVVMTEFYNGHNRIDEATEIRFSASK